jgi:hypothetical protein
VDFRPTLHCAQDEGAIGWPSSLCEQQKLNLRITITEDEWHRIINDLGYAARQSGVWLPILEWGCVANFRAGPWKGASFLAKLKGCCQAYYRDTDHTDELFVALYDRIADDFDMTSDFNYGSSEHRAMVFAKCARHKAWQTKGSKMKMGRWTSWYMCQEQLRDGRYTLLVGLVLVGLEQGWWTSLLRSPLLQVVKLADVEDPGLVDVIAAPPEEAAPVVVDAEEPTRQTVAASNAELRKARGSCKSQMHFAAMVLANPYNCQLVDILCAASKPIRLDFWTAIATCMMKIGAFQRDVALLYIKVLIDTVAVWSDNAILKKLGFTEPHAKLAEGDEWCARERKLLSHWTVLDAERVGLAHVESWHMDCVVSSLLRRPRRR